MSVAVRGTNPHSCHATSAGQVPTWRWQWSLLVLCLELVTFETGAVFTIHKSFEMKSELLLFSSSKPPATGLGCTPGFGGLGHEDVMFSSSWLEIISICYN